MENKNTLIFSIVGVVVLIILVVGISFAMYSFAGTGTRENVIETGSVSLDCDFTTLTLTNQYPSTDAVGSALTGENTSATCTMAAEMNGTMTINYELALVDIVPGNTLTSEHIKFNFTKNSEYKYGSANTGITVASHAVDGNKGTLITDGYVLDSGSFTTTGTNSYVLKAWVADTYNLPQNMVNEDGTHTNNTTSETYTFKLKCVGAQA